MISPPSQEFIQQALLRLHENAPRVERCFESLSEEDIWKKPNQASNSIGNLILHLCGNITQYIISSLGEREDIRNRDLEFSTSGGYNKTQLLQRLKSTVEQAALVIQNTSEQNLLKKRQVQGFQLTGIGIILHVVEHYSYHTGQIAFWTKLLKAEDLGFYEDFDLNTKNE